MCVTVAVSKAVADPFYGPLGKSDLPSILRGGGVLIGLELGVIVWELVEEDGYGQTVEDDSESDADESEDTTQYGLWVDVSVAHSGDADLQGERGEQSAVTDKHVAQTQKHCKDMPCFLNLPEQTQQLYS